MNANSVNAPRSPVDIVPMVEPEVLMDGAHDIDTCYMVTEWVLKETFQETGSIVGAAGVADGIADRPLHRAFRVKIVIGRRRQQFRLQQHAGMLARAVVEQRAPALVRIRAFVVPLIPVWRVAAALQG